MILRKRSGKRSYKPPISHRRGTAVTVDAAGNQQIEAAPAGVTTNVWNCENQRTIVALPSGARVNSAYNADFRRVTNEA